MTVVQYKAESQAGEKDSEALKELVDAARIHAESAIRKRAIFQLLRSLSTRRGSSSTETITRQFVHQEDVNIVCLATLCVRTGTFRGLLPPALLYTVLKATRVAYVVSDHSMLSGTRLLLVWKKRMHKA